MQGQQTFNDCDPNKTRIRGYRIDKHKRCGPIGSEKLVELVIDNVTAADTGNYTCLLDDFEGIEYATVTLIVGRLPCTLLSLSGVVYCFHSKQTA